MDATERFDVILGICLKNEAAYRLFSMLADISRRGIEVRLVYISMVRQSGTYTEEEIGAIARLVMTGGAIRFAEMLDVARNELVRREIEELTS